MADPKIGVRLPTHQMAAISRLMTERGCSKSDAVRILLDLGIVRVDELPDAWWQGHYDGLENGRREGMKVVLASVRNALSTIGTDG